MRGLRLYIPPFAPDDSGAAALFYNLGGITVILDAGGCAGNIAGFDEPRQNVKSAVFSAGLRDMDAILGRDELLTEKLASAAKYIDAKFIAIIGTPVPAVIATDYRALKRMVESKTDIPVVTVDTDGVKLYDEGISKAYLEMFKTFPTEKITSNKKILGILGATHFDFPENFDWNDFTMSQPFDDTVIYGSDGSFDAFKRAAEVEKNLVVSVSGLKAAKYLKQKFGIPFEVRRPLDKKEISLINAINPNMKKILIMHEQFYANELRKEIEKISPNAEVAVGCWFAFHKEYSCSNDIKFNDEEDFIDYVKKEDFEGIAADKTFLRAIPFYKKSFIPIHHFAVSGSEGKNV